MNTTFTFNSPVVGPNPPTIQELTTQYMGTTLQGRVTTPIAGIQHWTVPSAGRYQITCAGAQGARGSGPSSYVNREGGLGAKLTATFALQKGDVLQILVGQTGIGSTYVGSSDACTGGGGGGTFVVLLREEERIPLIVAAGGAGGSDYRYDGGTPKAGSAEQATTQPTVSSETRDASGFDTNNCNHEQRAKSFIEGGACSSYVFTRRDSSYPGFGCAGSNGDDMAGGSGGGYYGGTTTKAAVSYIHPELGTDEVRESGINPANGFVEIVSLERMAYILKKDNDYYTAEDVPALIEGELSKSIVASLPTEILPTQITAWEDAGYTIYRIVDSPEYEKLPITIIASPAPSEFVLSEVVLSDILIGVRITGGADITWKVSFDSGNNWNIYKDNTWIESDEWMTTEEINRIAKFGWRQAQRILLKGYINPTTTGTPLVTGIKLMFAETEVS